ncbi:hypothetical protein EAH88_18565 [Rhodanobacter glycinis]|uniref:TniQ domain-containing protein n=1 Tax=Rhodanobacter glycinis TaxID=582702 RepID=A0A502BUC7_9GAMM|nr:hypothetical protein EAH88_18565 [Rhodanobacter glycinis]
MNRESIPTTNVRDDAIVSRCQSRSLNEGPGLLTQGCASDYRWWLAAPGEDESLGSLFERADRLYGEPPGGGYVWQDDPHEDQMASLDAPNSRELLRLARMLGIPPRLLHAHRLEDGPALLRPSARRAYCPQCLREDHTAGRPRAFRRSWARIFVLSCSAHGIPLQWAEPRLATIVDCDLVSGFSALSSDAIEIVHLIDTFASTLEACLWRKQVWPPAWRGTPHAARALLICCLSNLIGQVTTPPAGQLWVPPTLTPLITFPARSLPPLHNGPWERIREVGRPAWRRAALWMTAWEVIRGLPERLRPETIPSAYLAEGDLWWGHHPPSPHTQKLHRVHAALRRLCAPFPVTDMKIPSQRRLRTKVQRRRRSGDELLLSRRGYSPLNE